MDPDILDAYRRAGHLAAQALEYGASLIKPGARIRDVLDKVESFITEHGGGIAFPAQVSINDVAAHFCPTLEDEETFKEGDLVKLDVGVHINGYVGDTARTVDLSSDGKHAALIEASVAARDAALKAARAGITPYELGEIIKREITRRGFHPIKNLTGHGLAQYQVHTAPSIPNIAAGSKEPLSAGTIIAIEPFATTGRGVVYASDHPTLFSLQRKKGVRSPIARQLLKKIATYHGLPFTTRWLEREFGVGKTKLGLLQLQQAGILHEYPPLTEEEKGLVSQSEHTLLILPDGCEVLTQH